MNRLIFLLVMALAAIAAWADSPLTSTHFADTYADEQMVQLAAASEGELSPALMNYLADADAPVDVRLAVVNKLGWNFDGKTTIDDFNAYLKQRYNAKDEDELARRLNAKTLAVYAYIRAMANYFNVNQASQLAHMALDKNSENSFSVAFIASLIDAQIYLDSDWAMVYKVVADVLADDTLNRDMRPAAIDAVMEYINLYKDY